jgi:hypothetical protein
MTSKPARWNKEAKTRWPRAYWINGNGQYALVADCRKAPERILTVTLWPSREEAEKAKAGIDAYACGGACVKNHWIEDLAQA